MLAKYFWQLPYWQIWLPLLVGMASGGACILVYRLFLQKPALSPPPAASEKKSQEYDPFVQGSPTEQRRAHRRGGNPVEVLLATEQNNTPCWRGWVLDRSVGGLCLSVSDEFEPGTILRALPVNAPPVTPWTDVEVRSCRLTKDGFELGCQFVKQPTWSILLLFG